MTPSSFGRTCSRELLIVVHPGSLCGSAECNLGKIEARAVREAVIASLNSWTGDVLVLDGELSDELFYFPVLDQAITEALARAPGDGERLVANDPEHAEIAVAYLARRCTPKGTHVALTGAWYDSTDASGCVNATRAALIAAGYTSVTITDSCAELSPYEMLANPDLDMR